MLLTEYNEAKTMEMFKEEGREEGREEGLKEAAVSMHNSGMAPSDIAKILNKAVEKVKIWLDITTT